MKFDKFTLKAQEALATAQQIAMAKSNTVLSPLHLLSAGCSDDDGVVVIPKGLLEDVVEEALVFEDREEFIRVMLAQGHKLEGLYPTGPEMEARFRQWRAERAR